MMKGDKELEKSLSEIPNRYTTSSSSSHHYHHQMLDKNMGFPSSTSSCCNMVCTSDHGSISSNNYQATNSHLVDQLMMVSSTTYNSPDRCYWRTNNGCVNVNVNVMGGDALTQQFHNMNLGDMNNDALVCTNNSRSVDPNNAGCRNVNNNIPLLNKYLENSTCSTTGMGMGMGFRASEKAMESYVVDVNPQKNQSKSLYPNSGTSYYSFPFEDEESAQLASNDYHHRSCNVVDPMYKPYSHNINEALLHPCETTLHPMNRSSTDLIHPKPVTDNTLYNRSSYLKGRMRGDECRGLFPHQSLLLMKTAKKLDVYGALEDTYIIQERCLTSKYDSSRAGVRNYHHTMPLIGNYESLELSGLMDPTGRVCENGRTFNSLSDVQGNIYLIAKDQNGCRFLQKKFEEGSYQDVEIIFNEIIDRIVELMMNPFGNYLIQKLLDVCDEQQRMRIVKVVTREACQLVRISLNTHGTRVVQKLIETLSTHEQISLVVVALEPGFLDLIKDLNGNHVIQRCLQCLSSKDNKFIFDAAANFCVEIATHRHGCCVLQRCIDHSNGEQRQKLIAEICANGRLLTQDPFGNYVVQYILEKKIQSVSAQLVSQFEGHYVHLSMQKFSSHVVEKCLKFYEESRPRIVHELLSVSHFDQVLQDQYANYVIQSALDVTKGHVHDSLVAAVRHHTILRTNPYCKKIFSRGLLKK